MSRRIENEDWSGAYIKNVNFGGAKIVEANLDGASFSGYIGSLKINGLYIWPLMEAELKRRHPELEKLKPSDVAGCREAIDIVFAQLDETFDRARRLSEEQRRKRVDDEWSAVETVRHIVMVIDGWLGKNICGQEDPFHPIGLTPSFMPPKPPGTSIDPGADPTFEEAVDVWHGRARQVRDYIESLSAGELDRAIDHPHAKSVREALWVIFDEMWAHNQYMSRDLETIESS